MRAGKGHLNVNVCTIVTILFPIILFKLCNIWKVGYEGLQTKDAKIAKIYKDLLIFAQPLAKSIY